MLFGKKVQYNAIEILTGDQKEGEGYKITLDPEQNVSVEDLSSEIKNHIDSSLSTGTKKEKYDAILDVYDLGDLYLDDNGVNRGKFADRGDIKSGKKEEDDNYGGRR